MAQTQAFLNIEQSISGQKWVARADNSRAILALQQKLGVPEIVARILTGRGIDADTAPGFMTPRLKDLLPDPSQLQDMDKAADRLATAVMNNETIAIFGDYDVDGATSAAVLLTYFHAIGVSTLVHIPDREKEGYGPNAPALQRFAEQGARICITVDCGTTAFEALTAGYEAGLDVIVADHHAPDVALPPAYAVVNPNRLDETQEYGHLAAVGVVFLLLIALNRALRHREFFSTEHPEPALMTYLDLVALGTVADVVPLTGLNRAFVAQGLKVMAQWQRPGLRALATVSGVSEAPTAYHLGFQLGPRINAGGRIGQSDLGVRLLSTLIDAEAQQLAHTLDVYNQDRKTIEAEMQLAAEHAADAYMAIEKTASSSAEGASAQGRAAVMVAEEGWHPGIIGIVAARLKEKYNRPALVGAVHNGVIKASGRSMKGIDLGAAVIAAHQQGLLLAGGGHAMAAGLTCTVEQWPTVQDFLHDRILQQFMLLDPVPVLALDGAISVGGATPHLVEQMEQLGPYCSGNPEPRLIIQNCHVTYADVVGEKHIKCTISDASGQRVQAIAFRALGSALGDLLLTRTGLSLHIAGKLRTNYWRGEKRIQLQIEDAAPGTSQ